MKLAHLRQLAWRPNWSERSIWNRAISWLKLGAKWGGIYGVAGFFGLAIAFVALMVGERPLILAMVPALMLLAITFFANRSVLLVALLVCRAGMDPLLEMTAIPIGNASMGVGALLNALIIMLAVSTAVESGRSDVKRVWIVFLPLVLVYFLNVFRSPTPFEAFKMFLNVVTWASSFVIGYALACRHGRSYVLKIISFSAAIPILVSAVMVLTGWKFGFTAARAEYGGTEANRFAGPFSHANALADYAVIVVVALLYLRRQASGGRAAKLLNWLTLLSMFALLLATRSRAGWVGCAAVLVCHAFLAERRFFIYLAMASAVVFSIPEIRDRLLELKADRSYLMYAPLNSFEWRQLLWKDGLANLHGVDWVFGKGVHAFFQESIHFFHLAGGVKWAAHNAYVTLIYDLGLIGAGIFIALMLTVLHRFVRAYQDVPAAAQSGIYLVVMFMLICITDNVLDTLIIDIYFWLAVGGLLGEIKVAKPALRESNSLSGPRVHGSVKTA